jgi:predicted AlkP superfamily pyrophosphatase or phosphodiesterase
MYCGPMPTTNHDSSDGSGLVNLVAELEYRASGSAVFPRLKDVSIPTISDHDTTVLVLFDGLGSHQLDHPRARDLASAHIGSVDAPFPTTTTVSLATIATGLPPSQHGLIAYQLWNPDVGKVVNTIHMTTMWGERIEQRHERFLPGSNLWERMSTSGVEVVTVQPESFDRTPLSRALYRGTSFVPYSSTSEAVDRTVEAADPAGRFVFLYIPHVDFAAHVAGQRSNEYDTAINEANGVWGSLTDRLRPNVLLVGTADHGHIDIVEPNKIRLSKTDEEGLILYGDARALFVRGDGARLANGLPGTWVPYADLEGSWGPGPLHEAFEDRRPDGIIFADDGYAIFHSRSNHRLVGHHGGLMPEERRIPVLVRGGS